MKDQLGDEPYQPSAFARSTDPGTSHAAARSVEPKVNAMEQRVAQAIIAAGDNGRTWDEIALDTGIDKATVSPRFKPLRKKNLIKAKVDQDGKRVTREGQTVWVRM